MPIVEDTVFSIRMEDGTQDDYEFFEKKSEPLFSKVADRALNLLKELNSDRIDYHTDRLQHSWQATTRAFRDSSMANFQKQIPLRRPRACGSMSASKF